MHPNANVPNRTIDRRPVAAPPVVAIDGADTIAATYTVDPADSGSARAKGRSGRAADTIAGEAS